MLRRVVNLSGTIAGSEATAAQGTRDVLPPTRVLDGFGAFQAPPPTARPVAANYSGRAKSDNPPGFYGPPEGLLAVNTLVPADAWPARRLAAARLEAQQSATGLRGRPARRAGAAADRRTGGAVLGGIYRLIPRRRVAAAMVLGVTLATLAGMATSFADQASDAFAMKATIETHLAYVVTGDNEADNVSKTGLAGLTLFLAQRTALEAGEPVGSSRRRARLLPADLLADRPSGEALGAELARSTPTKQGGTVRSTRA